jgi:hypothetical protein
MFSPGTGSVNCTSETSSAKTAPKPLGRTTTISLDPWTASKHLPVEMPIDMAVKNPRPRVIGHKPNRNFVSCSTNADYVTQYSAVPVIGTVPRTANDMEIMAMKMNGMLTRCHTYDSNDIMGQGLTGPPATPAGIVNSTTSPRFNP